MEQENPPFVIGIPIYQGVDLLDVAAPYEIFNWMGEKWKQTREVKVYLVAETHVAVLTRDGLQLQSHKTFDQVLQLDLIWVPGAAPSALKKVCDQLISPLTKGRITTILPLAFKVHPLIIRKWDSHTALTVL